MRIHPKLFFSLCVLTGSAVVLLMTVDFREAEVFGWEYNVSRNLDDYIHKNEITATIIPQDFCGNSALLVIMCISSPSSFEFRRIIRNTWGKDKVVMGYNISLYFLLGETTDLDVQARIEQESLKYQDIVQENFHDSYNNLTLKSAMMLKLFKLKCQNTSSYLLKIDEDVYLNLPQLVVDLVTRNKTENLLMGSVICGAKPIKDYRNKWYSGPSYLYSDYKYPNYISGTTYCMSGDVAVKLFNTALSVPVFHLEDVYLTGICATKIHLHLTDNSLFTYRKFNTNYCIFKSLITIHYQDPVSIKKIYRSLKDPDIDRHCQKKTEVFLAHKWITNNILVANKTWRKKECGL